MPPPKDELVRQYFVSYESSNIPIYKIQIAESPEIIAPDIVLQNIAVCLFVFTEFVGPVKYDREVKRFSGDFLKVRELHLMHDDILCRLYIGICKKHEIDRRVLQGRGIPHLILGWQRAEIREYEDN